MVGAGGASPPPKCSESVALEHTVGRKDLSLPLPLLTSGLAMRFSPGRNIGVWSVWS